MGIEGKNIKKKPGLRRSAPGAAAGVAASAGQRPPGRHQSNRRADDAAP